MDVLEHIGPNDEADFLSNICKSLRPNGAAIIGMPSIESQVYASPASKAGHVNCKSRPGFQGMYVCLFPACFSFFYER